MRIVWAAAYGNPAPGSFVPALAAVARALTGRGDTLDVVVPAVPDASWYSLARDAGAVVHVVDGANEAALRTRALDPDLVHAHFFDWLVPLTIRLFASRARLLWHIHSAVAPDGRRRRFVRARLKTAILGTRVERFVCVADGIAEEQRALGAPAERIVVVPNAVDGVRFRPPSAAERERARATLGIDGEPAIAFFGRDPAIKGADVLAGALHDLLARGGRRPTVVTVGTPEGARAALGQAARVVALERTDDVRSILWAADALALPSRGEGMPFVALEALACGLPVVASDLPATRELAAAYRGVALAPVADAARFGAALATALRERPVVAGPARDALDRWAERVVALYDRRPR